MRMSNHFVMKKMKWIYICRNKNKIPSCFFLYLKPKFSRGKETNFKYWWPNFPPTNSFPRFFPRWGIYIIYINYLLGKHFYFLYILQVWRKELRNVDHCLSINKITKKTEVIFFGDKDKDKYLLRANSWANEIYKKARFDKYIKKKYYFFQSNPLNIIFKILYI